MRLKVFTTVCLVASVLLAMATGLAFASRPNAGDPRAARRGYAVRLLSLSAGTVVCLLGAGVGSVLLLRVAREEYRAAARRNMVGLVEGLRADPEHEPERE